MATDVQRLPTIEPSDAQLAVIATLEERAQAAFAEIEAIEDAIDSLGPFGAQINFNVHNSPPELDLRCLHRLRVTGGREGFEQWYRYRIEQQGGVSVVIDDAEGPTPEGNRHYRQMLAIEARLMELDPEFVDELNLVTGAAIEIGGSERQRELYDETGEVYRTFVGRADAAISKLIESGWRP